MIPYTRVTIVAPSRRAEIVMPSDEPIGAQFPALLSLLGMTAGTELAAPGAPQWRYSPTRGRSRLAAHP